VTNGNDQFSPYDMATIFSARRDISNALHWLEKAIDQRSVDVIWLRVDPRLQQIRGKPGFQQIIVQMSPRRAP
jgi:hypothetical protein